MADKVFVVTVTFPIGGERLAPPRVYLSPAADERGAIDKVIESRYDNNDTAALSIKAIGEITPDVVAALNRQNDPSVFEWLSGSSIQ
jgi:hypothetical protein